MARSKKPGPRKLSYEHEHYGDEPEITKKSTNLDMIHAYNWYGHYHMADDAKKFTLEYLKTSKKYDKAFMKTVSQINANNLYNIGWNCRILSKGGVLPKEIEKKVFDKLELLVKNQKPEIVIEETDTKAIISIQERVAAYASDRIADLEDQIDLFFRNENDDFNAKAWFTKMNIKPQVATIIAAYYIPIYNQLFLAYKGTDPELNDAYSHWKRKDLKKYMEFIKSIVGAAETQKVVVKATRKQRKKKVKPASVIVSKMKYSKENKEYKLTSIKAEDIVDSKQLWIFNTKTRNLTVFNSIGDACLSVKGTTITGFDTNTSITKKLRKPEIQLKTVLTGGKVNLRQLMPLIKAKASITRGRINKDVILVRSIK